MSVDKLLKRHEALTHSENLRVVSHVQRQDGDWVRHTIMIENIDAPFVFKRTQAYQSLVGARVNMTYYRTVESVAGMEFEQMKVVRIKRS
ncbi:hypothetical protein [Alteromonas lipolytica]|uniref:Uncharacterized protein n=1 Tax=Alteromonas lipolytica TaxID=1856405 RepID=A0A1E8FCV5_9ALTE|nr:hypothetical protein [Alteromonas lipolytica]OFI33765.1 hypothetical protein BFC17_19525 [Alteromonas lipolytica]GGF68578.1 hypothetical protein GCM10011338_20980 [Alteromonas lipolytica]